MYGIQMEAKRWRYHGNGIYLFPIIKLSKELLDKLVAPVPEQATMYMIAVDKDIGVPELVRSNSTRGLPDFMPYIMAHLHNAKFLDKCAVLYHTAKVIPLDECLGWFKDCLNARYLNSDFMMALDEKMGEKYVTVGICCF